MNRQSEKSNLIDAVARQEIKSILLVRCQKIGDMITFLPTVMCVRKMFPSASITLLCHKYSLAVAGRIPFVKLVVIDSLKKKKMETNESFDLMVTSSQDAGWIGLKKKHRIRFAVGVLPDTLKGVCLKHRWQYRCFTHTEQYTYADHDVDRNLRALKILGDNGAGSSTRTLWITEEERKGISFMTRKGPGPLVVVSPSGSKPSKNWSPDKFAILCDKLVAEYKSDIVFAGKGQLSQEQTMAIKDRMKEKAVSLVNKTTFGQLAALIEKADLLISVDSGPAHIASYLERPLIVLFGPGDFEQWGPWHWDSEKGVTLKALCKCGTIFYKCLEKTHCLDTISPENVFGKAAEFLNTPTEKT